MFDFSHRINTIVVPKSRAKFTNITRAGNFNLKTILVVNIYA